jgi:hypothetical protein
MENKTTIISYALLVAFVGFFLFTFISQNTHDDISTEVKTGNIYFALATDDVSIREPTQYDKQVGILNYDDKQLIVYQSKTIKKFDYGKFFIGGVK